MTENMQGSELKDRLELIESMIAEGRRKTENWGWTFVLWGVAYYVAIAWSSFGHSGLAWPVTMVAAGAVTGLGASRNRINGPETTLSRAVGAVWIAMSVSIFVLMLSLGFSGKLEQQASVAIVSAMLGMANGTSSLILKWKVQFACAVVWWAACVTACFGTEKVSSIAFLSAIFLCQIVFGIYAMMCESRRRQNARAIHA